MYKSISVEQVTECQLGGEHSQEQSNLLNNMLKSWNMWKIDINVPYKGALKYSINTLEYNFSLRCFENNIAYPLPDVSGNLTCWRAFGKFHNDKRDPAGESGDPFSSGQTKAQTRLTDRKNEHGFRPNAIKLDDEVEQSILVTSVNHMSGRWKHKRAESILASYSFT